MGSQQQLPRHTHAFLKYKQVFRSQLQPVDNLKLRNYHQLLTRVENQVYARSRPVDTHHNHDSVDPFLKMPFDIVNLVLLYDDT